ncbi:MAG: FtsQ-type POTRA domain-containing protein [Magnetospirillum sp.]|nr:FtsQ-type POTRA domain-containing protein [Magnetospirillum sp.]
MRRMNDSDIVITPEDRPGAPRPAPRSAPEARRRRPPPRLPLTPVQKGAGIALAAVVVVGLLAATWTNRLPHRLAQGVVDGVFALTAVAGFRIEDIAVTGRSRTPVEQVVAALGVHHGDPIFGLDIALAKQRLEAIPSVRAAAVERRLPTAIHIVLAERQPVALWQSQGRFVLVDKEGRQIPGAVDGYEALPLVVGEGAPGAAAGLRALLAGEPELEARVKAAIRVGDRRWDIRLDHPESGTTIKLPEDDAASAWHRFAELERRHQLTAKNPAAIDLRQPDRLWLQAGRAPAAAERRGD